MSSTPLLGRFYFERSVADLPKAFCNTCRHIVSETGGRRHVCQTRPTSIYSYPMCYLPHTVIISDLGSPNGNFHLEFNRVLSENSAMAVFSMGQEATISGAWPRNRQSNGCWSRMLPTKSSRCYATVSVGSYWPFKISYKAIWYWNAEDGVLLVDWNRMYNNYFAQARSNKNKRRIERIVQRYRDLEAEQMRNDTEGQWLAYGDWDVLPATHAEIAMACRSEGPRANFETRLDPRKNQITAQELIMRLGDSIVAVGDALRRCVDSKSNLYAVDDREEGFPKGSVSLWNRASYAKIL